MTPRSFALASALVLGLTGLAQAQARSMWQEPERRPPGAQAVQPAPAGTQTRVQEAQAVPPREAGSSAREAQAPAARERVQAPRDRREARGRAERRSEVRSARYRGGSGATWKTGRDSHGFAGSFGGCRFRGSAGPNGYRLDRSC